MDHPFTHGAEVSLSRDNGPALSDRLTEAEFAQFLNISRRSVFEVANILFVLRPEKILPDDSFPDLLVELEEQSRMTLAFIRRLRS